MSGLLNVPLTAKEIGQLPDKLRLRYRAAEISDGISGLSTLDKAQIRRECRYLLAWRGLMRVGASARYIGIASAYGGKKCRVEAVGDGDVSISVPGFADRFLVDPLDLEPA